MGIGYGGDVTAAVADALGKADVVIGHEDFLTPVRHLLRRDAACLDVVDQREPAEDVFTARARAAARHAGGGAHVVLVSGGDPGLLGMAGPVLATLSARHPEAVPDVRVLPGLSAWQYASAALGAPFNGGVAALALCLASHTDGLVRRQARGVAASGLGATAYMLRHNGETDPDLFPTEEDPTDLSRRRFTLLRDAFLEHRPEDTPTFLLSGLGAARGHTVESAPLARSLDLWATSGPTSVFCVPAEDTTHAAGRCWALT